MSNVEILGNNQVKITMEVDYATFEENVNKAYNKNKNRFNLDGFRKGKAPRKMIEKFYGKEVFYEDAINFIIPDFYGKAIEENNLDVVSRPAVDVQPIREGENVIIEATVYVSPEVKINDYMGIEIEKVKTAATEQDIEDAINEQREKNARVINVEDRAVIDGDTVNINFEGFCDGVAFDGGKAENYDLNIGSNTFVDTFEEQLIGKNLNEELDVNVTFPENYGNENLKGKAATFKVKINEIKTKDLPECNDDFASEISEFETFEEYKNDLVEKLNETFAKNSKIEKENKVIEALVNKAEIDLPQVMIDNRAEQMVNDFASQLKQQGLELKDYLEYMGQSVDSLKEVYSKDAEKQVRGRLVLQAVAKDMQPEITEADIDEEIQRIADQYKMEMEKFKEVIRPEDIEGLKEDLSTKKALDQVVSEAKEI